MAKQKKPLSIGAILLIVLLAWWLQRQQQTQGPSGGRGGQAQAEAEPGTAAIVKAFREKRSGVWVQSEGEIVHLLPDDRRPPRHQLFLVELAGGHTIKISHNVDLAPKAPVRKGTRIRFRGRFEHNSKGGVVHWTHHDPKGRKAGGWLEYEGKTYK